MPEEGESASSGDGTPIRPEIGSESEIPRTPEITAGTWGDVSRVTGDGTSSRPAHVEPLSRYDSIPTRKRQYTRCIFNSVDVGGN